MSTLYGIIAVVAVIGVIFACVYKAEGGETYEDRQRKMADKLFGKDKKDKGR